MKANVRQVSFLECPNCQCSSSFQIPEYFELGQSFREWYCKNCGVGIRGVWNGNETEIEIVGQHHPLLMLVKVPEPIVLLIQDVSPTLEIADIRYWIEEKSCPENTLNQSIHSVIVHDTGTNLQGLPLDTDPHSFLQVLGVLDFNSLRFDQPEMTNSDVIGNLSAQEIDDLFQGVLGENLI